MTTSVSSTCACRWPEHPAGHLCEYRELLLQEAEATLDLYVRVVVRDEPGDRQVNWYDGNRPRAVGIWIDGQRSLAWRTLTGTLFSLYGELRTPVEVRLEALFEVGIRPCSNDD